VTKGSGRRKLTVMLLPDGGETRTLTVTYRQLRALAAACSVVAVLLTLFAGSWWYLAARAAGVDELKAEVKIMTQDRARVKALVQRLEGIEGQYSSLRTMFGAGRTEQPSGVWLPPVSAPRQGYGGERVGRGYTRPTFWPLTEHGFVTQELHGGEETQHPGLDIAVTRDSYIRASGGGTIVDVGEDAVYGRFVVIDHGEGYATLYGHASTTFVSLGQPVRERQVVALTGSTGRSTGPHLHFEVLVEGEPIDPLTFVEQPG
jgi:murein DD-endopeptidase MepM/ murein hydrolase activator NlpD